MEDSIVAEKLDEVDVCHERDRLRMRVAVLEESVRSYEVESKASRETVMRLVAELSRERRNAATSAEALDSLRQELDGLALRRQSSEMEQQSCAERLEASRRVIEAAKRESQCLESQVQELSRKLHASQEETQAAQRQLQSFLGKLAGLLSDSSDGVTSSEKDILLKVNDLSTREADGKMAVSEVESRLAHVSEELTRQTELHHSALQRSQLAEQQVQDLRERLRGLEGELLTADVHRDGLSHNKQHYDQFLDQLSETMKVDSIAVDLGFDMRLKLILSRAEQLIKHEGKALVETKTLTHSQQRKLKAQRERLESKELHLELLRKKVSELEEEKRSRSALSTERDDAHLTARKLQKKVERLQAELKETRVANTELRAQLSHTNELKLKVMEQSQTMQQQTQSLAELVEGKAEVERTLGAVSSDLQRQQRKAQEDQQQLTTLRQTLAQLSERERELLDFRTVVSQMLGLESTALALPNYEIIKYLESLLQTPHHQHHLLHHHLTTTTPWLCPVHQQAPLPQILDASAGGSLDVSTSRSVGSDGVVPLHGT